ncbi:hypothetical protein SD436_09875 [Streptococcus sp. 2A/TPW/M5]
MRYLTAGESHGPRLTAIIEGSRQAFLYLKRILIKSLNVDKVDMVVGLG